MPLTALWRWRFVPYVVLAASLAMTIAVAGIAHREVAKRDEVRFRTSVDHLEGVLTQQLDTYTALLRGAAGLFAADPVVSAGEFHDFVERLDLRERYPGMLALGCIERVPRADLGDFLARRRLSDPGFTVRPPPDERELFPIVFLEPGDEFNRKAVGFDSRSEP